MSIKVFVCISSAVASSWSRNSTFRIMLPVITSISTLFFLIPSLDARSAWIFWMTSGFMSSIEPCSLMNVRPPGIGENVGAWLGVSVGCAVGLSEGVNDGAGVGNSVVTDDDDDAMPSVGVGVGSTEGSLVGVIVGSAVGSSVGESVLGAYVASVGATVGAEVSEPANEKPSKKFPMSILPDLTSSANFFAIGLPSSLWIFIATVTLPALTPISTSSTGMPMCSAIAILAFWSIAGVILETSPSSSSVASGM